MRNQPIGLSGLLTKIGENNLPKNRESLSDFVNDYKVLLNKSPGRSGKSPTRQFSNINNRAYVKGLRMLGAKIIQVGSKRDRYFRVNYKELTISFATNADVFRLYWLALRIGIRAAFQKLNLTSYKISSPSSS